MAKKYLKGKKLRAFRAELDDILNVDGNQIVLTNTDYSKITNKKSKWLIKYAAALVFKVKLGNTWVSKFSRASFASTKLEVQEAYKKLPKIGYSNSNSTGPNLGLVDDYHQHEGTLPPQPKESNKPEGILLDWAPTTFVDMSPKGMKFPHNAVWSNGPSFWDIPIPNPKAFARIVGIDMDMPLSPDKPFNPFAYLWRNYPILIGLLIYLMVLIITIIIQQN